MNLHPLLQCIVMWFDLFDQKRRGLVSHETTAFPEEVLESFSGKIEMDNLTISRGTPLPMTAAWGRVIWVKGVEAGRLCLPEPAPWGL